MYKVNIILYTVLCTLNNTCKAQDTIIPSPLKTDTMFLYTQTEQLNSSFEKVNVDIHKKFWAQRRDINKWHAPPSPNEKAAAALEQQYGEESLPYRFNPDYDIVLNDGSIIDSHYGGDYEEGQEYKEMIYPPPPAFYTIEKHYYSNGYIKQKGKIFGKNVKIGIWYYFDNTGKLVKEVNEDAKFEKMDHQKVLSILQEKQLIDTITGANRDGIEATFNDSILVGTNKYWKIKVERKKDINSVQGFMNETINGVRWKGPFYYYYTFTIDSKTGAYKFRKGRYLLLEH